MRLITLNRENVVVGVRFGKSPVSSEVQSDIGEVGQIMQEDGTFITPVPEPSVPDPSVPDPTIEQQILYENQYQTMLLEMGGIR